LNTKRLTISSKTAIPANNKWLNLIRRLGHY